MRNLKLLGLALMIAATAACSKHNLADSEAGAQHPATPSTTTETSSVALGPTFGDSPEAAEKNSMLATRVFYFPFDSDKLSDADKNVLKVHAEYLVMTPHAAIRIEGHTDERGSAEYNVGLGERRAKAVQHFLLMHGGKAEQISIVSYGKERPAVRGHDESAWRMNRRARIVYDAY